LGDRIFFIINSTVAQSQASFLRTLIIFSSYHLFYDHKIAAVFRPAFNIGFGAIRADGLAGQHLIAIEQR